ncbi:hypothetical protein E24_00202 [Faustovirus]|nr:hypothetical protein PRJ_Fausto_00188 [Faustovirus]AMN83132.1 hypothetical protein E24_00202 [Faustovirus]AMN84113.1 hypothetical protein D5a_00200 [Faustovirus]AMN85101.1 hypothetical protein E23_00201 [Faustovirus]QBR99098.1 hypothetical protein [Faustovirus mariensis]
MTTTNESVENLLREITDSASALRLKLDQLREGITNGTIDTQTLNPSIAWGARVIANTYTDNEALFGIDDWERQYMMHGRPANADGSIMK